MLYSFSQLVDGDQQQKKTRTKSGAVAVLQAASISQTLATSSGQHQTPLRPRRGVVSVESPRSRQNTERGFEGAEESKGTLNLAFPSESPIPVAKSSPFSATPLTSTNASSETPTPLVPTLPPQPPQRRKSSVSSNKQLPPRRPSSASRRGSKMLEVKTLPPPTGGILPVAEKPPNDDDLPQISFYPIAAPPEFGVVSERNTSGQRRESSDNNAAPAPPASPLVDPFAHFVDVNQHNTSQNLRSLNLEAPSPSFCSDNTSNNGSVDFNASATSPLGHPPRRRSSNPAVNTVVGPAGVGLSQATVKRRSSADNRRGSTNDRRLSVNSDHISRRRSTLVALAIHEKIDDIESDGRSRIMVEELEEFNIYISGMYHQIVMEMQRRKGPVEEEMRDRKDLLTAEGEARKALYFSAMTAESQTRQAIRWKAIVQKVIVPLEIEEDGVREGIEAEEENERRELKAVFIEEQVDIVERGDGTLLKVCMHEGCPFVHVHDCPFYSKQWISHGDVPSVYNKYVDLPYTMTAYVTFYHRKQQKWENMYRKPSNLRRAKKDMDNALRVGATQVTGDDNSFYTRQHKNIHNALTPTPPGTAGSKKSGSAKSSTGSNAKGGKGVVVTLAPPTAASTTPQFLSNNLNSGGGGGGSSTSTLPRTRSALSKKSLAEKKSGGPTITWFE
eukprot:PhF_6_TR4819/c0_g1_i1/m.6669